MTMMTDHATAGKPNATAEHAAGTRATQGEGLARPTTRPTLSVSLELKINGTPYALAANPPAEGVETSFRLVKATAAGSHDLSVYDVTRYTEGFADCTCADYEFRIRGNSYDFCKHMKALVAVGLLAPPRCAAGPVVEVAESRIRGLRVFEVRERHPDGSIESHGSFSHRASAESHAAKVRGVVRGELDASAIAWPEPAAGPDGDDAGGPGDAGGPDDFPARATVDEVRAMAFGDRLGDNGWETMG